MLGDLCDHLGRVWRKVETVDDLQAVHRTHTLVYDNVPFASDGQNTVPVRDGSGMTLGGSRDLYTETGYVFQRDDVIQMYEGPTAPFKSLVESWDNFRGDHIEIRATEYDGLLPNEV